MEVGPPGSNSQWLSLIKRERAADRSLPPWDCLSNQTRLTTGLIPMRRAEQAVIVCVERVMIRLDCLPCRALRGNGAPIVDRPPRIRCGDGGSYATAVVSDQHIQLR